MLGGLYGELPQAKNKDAGASAAGPSSGGWAQKPKFAPPVRKPVLGPPRSVLGPSKKRPREADGAAPAQAPAAGPASSAGRPVLSAAPGDGRLVDEYDPARPNEYEAVRKERERQKEEARRQAEAEELKLIQEQEAKAAAAALAEAKEKLAAAGVVPGGVPAAEPGGEGSFAQRMMQKMGWKEGLGLGRSHQGITAPLVAQKTDARTAVIVNEGAPAEKRPRGASFQGAPSRVVLLRNIVGPGEVDASLEDEIGEECSKYGGISYITIFEVTEPGFPADQAVRIFVQFERQEAALKALIDLEGRFFGGRKVRATFFAEDKFERQELAPVPGQDD